MSIDTANKRASAFVTLLPFLNILPWPDTVIDQSDRQQLAGIYAGIYVLIPPFLAHVWYAAMTNAQPVQAGAQTNAQIPALGAITNTV